MHRQDPYGYDFKTLRNENRHVINNVRRGFPADLAGLRDGDYILHVNGEPIDDDIDQQQVVAKLLANPTQVYLLVVADLNGYLTKQQKPKKTQQ